MDVRCGKLATPPTTIEETFSFEINDGPKDVEVSCPSGYRVLSGGYEFLTWENGAFFTALGSYPVNATTWRVRGQGANITTARVKVTAVCVEEAVVDVNFSRQGRMVTSPAGVTCVEATCQSGAYVGGGALWGDRRLVTSARKEGANAHEVCVAGGDPGEIAAYALCAEVR